MAIVTETYECEHCRVEIDEDTWHGCDGFCHPCYDERYPICSECGLRVYYCDYRNDDDMCDECFWDKYAECDVCGREYERDMGADDTCPDCRKDRFTSRERDRPYSCVSWAQWAEFAEFTRTVDFGCNFDCKGGCSGTRVGEWVDRGEKGTRGCCRDCARSHGYLDNLPPGAGSEVRALYDEDKGFWREGIGCILPPGYRSGICLTYTCYARNRRSREDQMGMKAIGAYQGYMAYSRDLERLRKEEESNPSERLTLRIQEIETRLTQQKEKLDRLIEAHQLDRKVKAARAAEQERRARLEEAGRYGHLGYTVDSDEVERLVQLTEQGQSDPALQML